jgi:CxxC motif-containing protein
VKRSNGAAKEEKESTVICILCPKGCRAILRDGGEEIENPEKLCKRGIRYVQEERREPKRLLTTTVKTKDSRVRLFPVRTSGPVPKVILPDCMQAIAALAVKPPIRCGEVIVSNLLHSGQDLIASDDLPF